MITDVWIEKKKWEKQQKKEQYISMHTTKNMVQISTWQVQLLLTSYYPIKHLGHPETKNINT